MKPAAKKRYSWILYPFFVFSLVVVNVPSPLAKAEEEGPLLEIEQPGGGFAVDGQYAEVEVVRERYPNRKVKIEREVTLDAQGNYVNHGSWKMWSPQGEPVAAGQYNLGKRDGVWMRWHTPKDSPALRERPFNSFQSPFVSQVTYVDGVIEGDWTIFDAKERKCSLVTLKDGTRHGPAIVWLPSGSVFREEVFENGLTVGDVLQMDRRGELKKLATYVDGRQVTTQATNFDGTRNKQTEATYLAPKKVVSQPDDFWNAKFAQYEQTGEALRHGTWKSWFSNGQLKLEGTYRHDNELGTFTWWYPNGQKAVVGEYVDGQQHGEWVWWHENGLKASLGSYAQGEQTGKWREWNDTGKLESQIVHDGQAPTEVYVHDDAEQITPIEVSEEEAVEELEPVEVAEKPDFEQLPWLK